MLLSPIYIWRGFPQQFFYILFATTHFWILWKKIQNKLSGQLAKVEKTTKQVENQQIFIVTLTKKFSMPDYWYNLYKFTQYTWALNSSLFWRIQLISNVFLGIFDKKCLFPSKLTSYQWYKGASQQLWVISQFSQFCVITAHISAERHLSKISYENFNSPLPPLTFKTIIIFHVKPFFTSSQRPTVNHGYVKDVTQQNLPRGI